MSEPDMEVRIYPENKSLEALTFQNNYMASTKKHTQLLGNITRD
jgi:hypothetical protein